MALRAGIVLACAERAQPSNQDVAERLRLNQATVGKWRRRFVAERLDGLVDDPRPGAPRTITDDKVGAGPKLARRQGRYEVGHKGVHGDDRLRLTDDPGRADYRNRRMGDLVDRVEAADHFAEPVGESVLPARDGGGRVCQGDAVEAAEPLPMTALGSASQPNGVKITQRTAALRPSRWSIVGYAAFFGMLFVPTTYQVPRAALFAALAAVAVLRSLTTGTFRVATPVFNIFLVYFGLAVLEWAWGETHNAPGATASMTVFFAWPLLFLLLMSMIQRKHVHGLVRTMVVATLAIEAYAFIYLSHEKGWLPARFYIPLAAGQNAGFYSQGSVAFTLLSLTSLIFLVPFNLALLLTWPKNQERPIRNGWLWASLIAGVVLSVLSGRRGFVLAIGITPLLVLIARAGLPRLRAKSVASVVGRSVVFGVIALLAIASVGRSFNLTYSGLRKDFLAGFDFGGRQPVTTITAAEGKSGAQVRAQEATALWAGFNNAPLLGAGLGNGTAAFVRDPKHPWAYELSYFAYLYQLGAIGFVFYLAGFVWIWVQCRRIAVSSDKQLGPLMLPLWVGIANFLIANATNPYLSSLDFLWVLFLPVALINVHMHSGSRSAVGPRRAAREDA